MAAKVNPNPILSTDTQYLLASLLVELRAHAQRINLAWPEDGTEAATAPMRLASYTVGTLPSASKYPHGIIYVSDGTVNKRLAISDGTNWRWPDGNIVS